AGVFVPDFYRGIRDAVTRLIRHHTGDCRPIGSLSPSDAQDRQESKYADNLLVGPHAAPPKLLPAIRKSSRARECTFRLLRRPDATPTGFQNSIFPGRWDIYITRCKRCQGRISLE